MKQLNHIVIYHLNSEKEKEHYSPLPRVNHCTLALDLDLVFHHFYVIYSMLHHTCI
jgi:hypothetical protein